MLLLVMHNVSARKEISMKLSQHNAFQIVSNINEIISQKINLINANGIIIASTDEARIGTYHAGAKKLINEHLDELVINEEEGYEGSLPGINYPLVVKGEVIGVVGVTGNDENTLSYAKIVKRMTELLIQELSMKEEQETDENIKNRFLDEWLGGNAKSITKAFIERGLSIGIDIRIPRRFLAMSVYSQSPELSIDSLRKLDSAEQYLRQLTAHGIYNFSMPSSSFIIAGVPVQTNESLQKMAKDFQKLIQARFSLKVAVGIDSPANDGNYLMAYKACIQAKKALHACLRTHLHDLRFYDDLNMEIFTDELPENVKIEYIHKIFKGMNDEEIFKAVQILETYYDEEGSINRAADKLFIHKNTMQNRLRQIQARTGYDPRSIRHSSLFYNALYFYREITKKI